MGKPTDYKMLQEHAHGLERQWVPNGTIGVFVATEAFQIRNKKCEDLSAGVFIHSSGQLDNGNTVHTASTSRVTSITWNSEGQIFAAGLYLKLALLEDTDSLLDLKHQKAIDKLMGKSEKINKREPLGENALPHAFLPTTTNLHINHLLIPQSSFIPPNRIVYSTKCPVTYCPQIAWIRDDGKIEIHTFDRFRVPQLNVTTCQDCLLQIQRAVRWLKHENPFVMGDLPKIYEAPPTYQITGYNFLPNAPFRESNLVCVHKAPGAAEHYFLTWRDDGQLGMHTLCCRTNQWTSRVPEHIFKLLLENARSRGINNNVCNSKIKSFVETVNNGYHTSLSTGNVCDEWNNHLRTPALNGCYYLRVSVPSFPAAKYHAAMQTHQEQRFNQPYAPFSDQIEDLDDYDYGSDAEEGSDTEDFHWEGNTTENGPSSERSTAPAEATNQDQCELGASGSSAERHTELDRKKQKLAEMRLAREENRLKNEMAMVDIEKTLRTRERGSWKDFA